MLVCPHPAPDRPPDLFTHPIPSHICPNCRHNPLRFLLHQESSRRWITFQNCSSFSEQDTTKTMADNTTSHDPLGCSLHRWTGLQVHHHHPEIQVPGLFIINQAVQLAQSPVAAAFPLLPLAPSLPSSSDPPPPWQPDLQPLKMT